MRPSVHERLVRLTVVYHEHPDPLYVDGYLRGWMRGMMRIQDDDEFDPRAAFVAGYRAGRRDRLHQLQRQRER